MKNALLRRRLNEFADLLDQAWQEKKRMSPRITTGFIDEAYAAARKAGALGGKVTGAGGGGYMLFYCEFQRKHRVAEALTQHGRPGDGVRVRAQRPDHLEPARWLTPTVIRARLELHAEMAQALIDPQVEATAGRGGAMPSARCYRQGGKVLLFGNGGSAADAEHIAGELTGRYLMDRAPLPAIALADNAAGFTAIGNDYGYGEVFARQMRAFGRPGDVAIGLSTSGGSANVLAGAARGARPRAGHRRRHRPHRAPAGRAVGSLRARSLPTTRRRSRRARCSRCTRSASWSSMSCSA